MMCLIRSSRRPLRNQKGDGACGLGWPTPSPGKEARMLAGVPEAQLRAPLLLLAL